MARKTTTRPGRPKVAALDKFLSVELPVLDHGFVRVVDYMGNDDSIVQAARVSYGRGTKKSNEDRALIRYLMRHRHTTPFEMAEIKLHVKLPIFVARQWIRHRTASVNEYSARYSILDSEFYLPDREHIAPQAASNKQGRGVALKTAEADKVIDLLRHDAQRNYDNYTWMLNSESEDEGRVGIARELARINLTLNTYTQWYWKIDLHNLLHFLHLRLSSHAQYEIRAYAELISRLVESWVPITYEAFSEYVLEAIVVSRTERRLIARALAGEAVEQSNSGLTNREWNEFVLNFGPLSVNGSAKQQP